MPDPITEHTRYINALAQQIRTRRGLAKLLEEIPDAADRVAQQGRWEISEILHRADPTA